MILKERTKAYYRASLGDRRDAKQQGTRRYTTLPYNETPRTRAAKRRLWFVRHNRLQLSFPLYDSAIFISGSKLDVIHAVCFGRVWFGNA